VTARNGDTLTISGPIEGTTDHDFVADDRVDVRWTDGLAKTIEGAVNTLETNSVSTASTYIDPPWISSLAGAKIAGNIAGSAASITGTITTSQVSNLSSWPGSAAITTLGTIATGTWQGAVINKTYLDATLVNTSGSYANPAWITSLGGAKVTGNITGNAATITGTITTSQVSDLGSWPGSAAITSLGTVATGTWQGSVIAPAKLGTGTPSAATRLRGDGSWFQTWNDAGLTKTGAYTMLATDTFVACNLAAGAFTVTLPSATGGALNQEFLILKTDTSGNTLTIARAGTDVFGGGATSMGVTGQNKYVRLIARAGVWFVVGSN